jgi:hypothetical protein
MKYKYSFFILLLLIGLGLPSRFYATAASPGFIKAPIWFSKEPFEEDDVIKVYTLIFNPDVKTFSGTVLFYDNTLLLGKKSFTVKPKEAQYVSVDWTVTFGNHEIFAKIEDPKFLLSNGKYETVSLEENQSEKSIIQTKKKVIDEAKDTVKERVTQANSQISKIQQGILENTPEAIATPVVNTANAIENFREELTIKTEIKRDTAKEELAAIDKESTKSTDAKNNTTGVKTAEESSSSKPLIYVEMFFYTIFAYILASKLLFYGLGIFVLFILLRFLWNKFL